MLPEQQFTKTEFMSLKTLQYIGVTGFKNSDQVTAALACHHNKDCALMVGVLASGTTIEGRSIKLLPKKIEGRYPQREEIASIFPDSPSNTLNLIHLCGVHKGLLYTVMNEAAEFGGKNFHGFQLNMAWPDPRVLKKWVESRGNSPATIVLQCGAYALDGAGNSPKKITERLHEYNGVADYCLIDPSGGSGRPFNPHFALECFEELYGQELHMRFGIAGGLCAESVDSLLGPLLDSFPDLCSDAEGLLHDEDGKLSVAKVQAHIEVTNLLIARKNKLVL